MKPSNLRIALLLLLAIASTAWVSPWVALTIALLAAAITTILFWVSNSRRTASSESVNAESSGAWREWSALTPEEQTALRIEFGHVQDSLPPTCSMDTKTERFRQWLATEKRVRYS